MELMSMSVIRDLYIDAVLTDESGHLIFMSVWGRDTALQEFIARLQLPLTENGIRDFRAIGEQSVYVQIPNVDSLEKTSAKTSRNTVFGQLTQLWIYDKLVAQPDRLNRRAIMLYQPGDIPNPWPLVRSVCHLPLLDHWRDAFLDRCRRQSWLRDLEGIGIQGVIVEMDDAVENVITEMIQNRVLTLQP